MFLLLWDCWLQHSRSRAIQLGGKSIYNMISKPHYILLDNEISLTKSSRKMMVHEYRTPLNSSTNFDGTPYK